MHRKNNYNRKYYNCTSKIYLISKGEKNMKKIIELLKMKNYKKFIETIKNNKKELTNEYFSNLYSNDFTNLSIKKLNYIEKII